MVSDHAQPPCRIGVVQETQTGERRVALVPAHVARLAAWGCTVQLAPHAGQAAGFLDQAYAGAVFLADNAAIWSESDLILSIHGPDTATIPTLRPGTVVVGLLSPAQRPEWVHAIAAQGVTAIALEWIPRITRAQAMDVLSSQATAVGYHAVVMAAQLSPKFFPMLTTAAGTIRPAKVLVVGAGVAGLQAIATARRLGAQVEAYDVRAATREQVESLGAKFIGKAHMAAEETGGYARVLSAEEQQAEQAELTQHVARADVVITTAAIPGKQAPVIITRAMLAAMQPGAVVVDMAAESGGNVEGTIAGKTHMHNGVVLYGGTHGASAVAYHASEMWSKNMVSLLPLLVKDGKVAIDQGDPIIEAALITHNGTICHPEWHARAAAI